MGDDKEPRPEGRLPPEARERLPDSHKDFLSHVVGDVIISDPRDGSCTSPLRIIVSPRKPSKMPPIQPVLEGARPWSHTFFITNSPCWHSYGSSFCCLSLGPSQVYSLHPCQRSPRRAWRCWGLCRHWHLL